MVRMRSHCARLATLEALVAVSVLFVAASCGSQGGRPDYEDPQDKRGLICQAPLVVCDGVCLDPKSSREHCGASLDCRGEHAGSACGTGFVCQNGSCVEPCLAGRIRCNGSCIDPETDARYCGARDDCQGTNAGTQCQLIPSGSRCPSPAQMQCAAGRCVAGCPSSSMRLSYTGKVEGVALPSCVNEIRVRASGAQGGTSTSGGAGGPGATVEGFACVKPGSVLSVVVGEQPPGTPYACGGGGGSYVVDGMTPLFVAGGGGGGYNNWAPGGAAKDRATAAPGIGGASYANGGGGGGFSASGAGSGGASDSGGRSFLLGSMGGTEFPVGNTASSRGGFGGGGGSSQSGTFASGGGGGYDGGKAGNGNDTTGGTSYIAPDVRDPTFSPASRSGHGSVEISW